MPSKTVPAKSKNKNNSKPSGKKITVTLATTKISDHLINLKNPNAETTSQASEKKFSAKSKTSQRRSEPPRPRALPKTPKSFGVDFISARNFFDKFDRIPIKKPTDNVVAPLLSRSTTIDPFADGQLEDIFSPPGQVEVLHLSLPRQWLKKLAIFLLIGIIILLPLQALTYVNGLEHTKDKILTMANSAISSLKLGQQSIATLDLTSADLQFAQAKNNFALADQQIKDLNYLTQQIIKVLPDKNKSVNSGVALLSAGQLVAESGKLLTESGQHFLNGKNLTDYYHAMELLQTNLEQILVKFGQAKSKIEALKSADLPADQQDNFNKIITLLPKAEQGLTDLYTIDKAFLKILGHDQWQRYLLVFLNNNEIRASGGFMGSYGLLDLDRGEIKKLDIPGGGTYDLQGWLGPKVMAPAPLQLINPRWEFQDANWWANFPTSAKKMEWFNVNAGGPTVDGVITITSTFIERLLAITGPIPMPEYGRPEITSQNFVAETQKIVQLEYNKTENKPKKFLADLTPKLMAKLFSTSSKEDLAKIIDLLHVSLNEKHLLLYFNDKKIENLLFDLGWAGQLRSTDLDYLMVVHTNVAGGKTDGVIKETIDHTAEVQADGSIYDTIKLTRRHTGTPGKDIFTGVQNNSYVRFYVPAGSQLMLTEGFKKPAEKLFKIPTADYQFDADLEKTETNRHLDQASGTDIYQESGKTVFGNWLQLKPGQTQTITIKYRLPFHLKEVTNNTFYYSLLAQKQPGSLGSDIHSQLKLTGTMHPTATFPANLATTNSQVSFKDTLNVDTFYAVKVISQ